MIKVSVVKQSNYSFNLPMVKRKLQVFLKSRGIVSDAEVSIAVVGENKMLEIGKKYLKDKNIHNVLSFTPEEVIEKFVYPPDGVIYLGEIIVCYPVVVKEAQTEGKLIDEKIYELIEHSALHLLGVHHE